MLTRRATLAAVALALLSTLVTDAAGTLQTPEQFLGFEVGTDNKLVRWDKIVEYMKAAAAGSDRVRFRELGKDQPEQPVHRDRNRRRRHAGEPRSIQAVRAQALLPGRRAERQRARRDLPPRQGRGRRDDAASTRRKSAPRRWRSSSCTGWPPTSRRPSRRFSTTSSSSSCRASTPTARSWSPTGSTRTSARRTR